MDQLTRGLGESELAVLRATAPAALSELAEDELIDLHSRVRRARNKYAGQYRRRASSQVAEAGGRGSARPGNRRAADRAEVFEVALARVSTALARSARRSAATLKAERLVAARAARSGAGPESEAEGPDAARASAPRAPVKSPGRLKRDASSQAAGARRQARRDSR